MDKKRFLDVIDAAPLVSIDLVVEDCRGQVLLGKRVNRPAQGYWFVPGGRIRKNETLAAAIKRISLAELGVEMTLDRAELLGAYDHIYDDNFSGEEGINTHYVALAHKVKVGEDFALKSDEQHSDMQWWSKERLLDDSTVHQNTKNYFIDL